MPPDYYVGCGNYTEYQCLDPMVMTPAPTSEPTAVTIAPSLSPTYSSTHSMYTLFALDFDPQNIFDVVEFYSFAADEYAIVSER